MSLCDVYHKETEASVTFPVPEGVKTPWFKVAGDMPTTLKYFGGTLIEAIEETAEKVPNRFAYEFFGHRSTFRSFVEDIHTAARGLRALGVRPGDKVTICMPNTPQAVILFYAVNRMGGIANLIHPLSGEEEIVRYINESGSVLCLTLKQFFPKFDRIRSRLDHKKLLICDIPDGLSGLKKALYPLVNHDKVKLPQDSDIVTWKDFMKLGRGYDGEYLHHGQAEDVAAILYSGGTTGTSKGILLTNLNFNALALQTGISGNCTKEPGTCLAIMPVFHGFGLGVCIHTMMYWGVTAILVPRFNAESYCQLLHKHKPNYIAGVPTLYEALLRMDDAQDLDMSKIKGIFSGGDSLSVELKRKVDAFLTTHGSTEQVREGYGTTECVTACCLTPHSDFREGSIGIPFPDTYFKICTPATHDEVPYGTMGEICISGPTVMLGYMNNPRETAQTLQLHEDGQIWLHTGDLGTMDEDGFVYFKQRLKRMIVTSGYNVYPSQVENVIDSHEDVLISTVIGVKDDYRMQRVKAFVVLRPGVVESEKIREELLHLCELNLPKYAIPREMEFRDDLPRTKVGKVAVASLEAEEKAKAEK